MVGGADTRATLTRLLLLGLELVTLDGVCDRGGG